MEAPVSTHDEDHAATAADAGLNGTAAAKRRMKAVSRQTIGAAERELERAGDIVWRFLKTRPSVGVILASGAGFALASAVGVGELAIAIGAGYAAYQVLKNNEPPSKALRELANLGHDHSA